MVKNKTKLKTMKELPKMSIQQVYIGVDEEVAKAEVIRWIKLCLEENDIGSICDFILRCKGCLRMMKFHNIIEQDIEK